MNEEDFFSKAFYGKMQMSRPIKNGKRIFLKP